jgi:hypothetical protein
VSTFNDIVGEGAVLGRSFYVPPPDVSCEPPPLTSRSVTLRLTRSLVTRGAVSIDDGFTACAAGVPVRIQRRVEGEWKTVRTATTSSTGSYKRRIPDRPGRYRATAPKITLVDRICLHAVSPVRTSS